MIPSKNNGPTNSIDAVNVVFDSDCRNSRSSTEPDSKRIQELKRRPPKPQPPAPQEDTDAINWEFDDLPPL